LKDLNLARRPGIRFVFDSLVAAAVASSNANHRLPLLAQPVSLSRLGVAPVVLVRAPSICSRSRTIDAGAGADGKLSHTCRRRNPAAVTSTGSVPHDKKGSRAAPAAVVAAQGLENILLGKIQPALLDLSGSIRELRPRQQQTAKVGAGDAQFSRVGDIDRVTAENLDHHIPVKMSDAVGNSGNSVEVVSPTSFSNCAIPPRRAT
jgi:hypothetical protein